MAFLNEADSLPGTKTHPVVTQSFGGSDRIKEMLMYSHCFASCLHRRRMGWERVQGDGELRWWALGWALAVTAGSSGFLAAAAGPEIPKGQGGTCWHLVSAKRVCLLECSISLGTGLEQRGLGVHLYVYTGYGGPLGDASWITQCSLPWCYSLSMANSQLESISFPNEASECCMLDKIYLSICVFMQGAGFPRE